MTLKDIFSRTLRKKLDKTYSKDYSDSVQDSMYQYSKNSNMVNKAFRKNNGKWNKDLEMEFGLTEKQFIKMYSNLDYSQVTLVEDTILYRGLDNPIDDFPLCKIIHDKGYASTSFNKAVSRYYATEKGTVMVIAAYKGTKGIYIGQYSVRPEEAEFLLPRGSKLQVYKRDLENNLGLIVKLFIV